MKEKIKQFLPIQTVHAIKVANFNRKMKKLYAYDLKRFKNGYNIELEMATEEQLKAKLMFFSHAIEKGLSHKDFRLGFGINALTGLSKILDVYNNKKFSKEELRYRIAIAAIKNYKDAHEVKGSDTSFLEDIFDECIISESEIVNSSLAGVHEVKREDKTNNSIRDFKKLALNRVSVREFSDEKVEIDDIKEAIEIALKTPSVCNRQPAKVTIVTIKENIKQVLAIQGGFKGFNPPDKLLLITSSNTSFISPIERNESFIDGGLFSMSLLYGLEFKGLAACSLNAMMSAEGEESIKNILNIPSDESLIMFIAVGHFLESSLSPKSTRDNINKVMRVK